MSVEILMPFGLAPDGSIAVTYNPNIQAQQHLESLVGTSPGERLMLPTYGIPLKDAVFAPNEQSMVGVLTTQINNAVANWEPNIAVNAVNVSDAVGDGSGQGTIDLDWSIRSIQNPSSSGVLTATILVGGTVVGS